jgi:hypothetical protein
MKNDYYLLLAMSALTLILNVGGAAFTIRRLYLRRKAEQVRDDYVDPPVHTAIPVYLQHLKQVLTEVEQLVTEIVRFIWKLPRI